MVRVSGMKETVIETPLIGSGSQEEADNRVRILLELGTSRGYLTYEELNEKLPDEVVSPDKLDTLLMMIDEMGIKLIDEMDIGEFAAKPRGGARAPSSSRPPSPRPVPSRRRANRLTANRRPSARMNRTSPTKTRKRSISTSTEELAEASTKRIDDPVRMYLTQMGEIPLLTREQEIALAKKIEITRKIFRSRRARKRLLPSERGRDSSAGR